MTARIATASPRSLARITGVFFLLTILLGAFAQGFVNNRLINFDDAAATANNILMHRGLFQLGFAAYLVELTCQVAMTALFYVLLRPVSKSVSLVSAFWGLTGCVIKIVARLFYIIPLSILGGVPSVLGGVSSLRGFSAEQLQALALVCLRVNDLGAGIALS